MNLGVTGGIASGKSTVLELLKGFGAIGIDADEISRRLTAPGTALAARILDNFGSDYALAENPQGFDRSKLARAVFQNPDLRSKLESLTHPEIVDEMQRQMDEASALGKNTIAVVETPLLFEIGLSYLFDATLVVWCCRRTQMLRLKSRMPNLQEPELMDRILSQLPIDDKRAMANYVIDSEKPFDEMARDAEALYCLLRFGAK